MKKYFVIVFLECICLCCFIHGKNLSQDFGRRERTYDVQHLKIEVHFNEPEKKVIGKVTTTIVPFRPDFKDFSVDAVAMTIKNVSLSNGTKLRFDYDSSKLNIHLDKSYRLDSKIIYSVEYECIPKRGIYFIQPDESFPNLPHQIWTQGQGEDNRYWVPCYDFPNDKATSEVIMTVPESYTTLSNGYLKSSTSNKNDKTKTCHWIQDKPHSSYLIMLAAGEYQIYKDRYLNIPVESYYYNNQSKQDVERAYRTTSEMVKFFSEKTGVKYPWDKYAQISVANFMYGGMENTTATVLNDQRTVVDARAALDYTPDGLIAHELAHQWWGDYLTYIDWWNAWLNEGFATFFQQTWTQHKFGEDEYRYQRFGAIENYIQWAKTAGRIPIVTDKGNGSQNIYGKGSVVLHMLRTILGEELFWKVMNSYCRKYAFQNVETNDFKRTIEDVTGMNLNWFFNQWVYKAGYPELELDVKEKIYLTDANLGGSTITTLTLTIDQIQKIDSVCGYFRMPVDIRVVTSNSDSIYHVTIDSFRTVYSFKIDSYPLLVSFDNGSNLCADIHFPKHRKDLIYQLQNDGDIIQRIHAGRMLIDHCNESGVPDAIKKSVTSDPFYGVREQLMQKLVRLNTDTISFKPVLKEIFLSALKDPRSGIRAIALGGLRKMKDKSLHPTFEKMLNDSSYYVVAGSLQCLADIDSITIIPLLRKYISYSSYRDVVAVAALELLDSLRAKESIPDIMKAALPGGSLTLRTSAINVLGDLGMNNNDIYRFFVDRLQEPSYQIRSASLLAVVKLNDPRTPSLLNKVADGDKDERVRTLAKKMVLQH